MPKKTNTKYMCAICGEEHSKKSVNDNHLKSEKHLKNCEILKLNLQMKTMDDILIDYPEYLKDAKKFENKIKLIDQIIKDRSSVKIQTKKGETTEQVNTMECQKYKPSNEVVWKLSDNSDNSKYKEQFSKLQQIIDSIHQFMFNNNQINGITAMRDMMKVLPMIILKEYFSSDDFKKEIDDLPNLPNDKKKIYKIYSSDITLFIKEENTLNKWKLYVINCLSKILPDIYKEGDGIFEFNKSGKGEKTFIFMIQQFSNIKVDTDFKDGFASSCGDIHELFRKYAGKKEAKDFGGFNTPRHALNMIYDFNQIKKLINERLSDDTSIFDPTMGTAGFLTRFFNLFNMNAKNIYGCELSPDTIKFAFVSLYLTTGKILKNLESCNSLSESDNIFKKHIIGLANPPFGTSIKYKKYTKGKGAGKQTFDGEIETFVKFHMEEKYDSENDKKEDEEKYKNLFKEIYPIETNNGACLFTQHFVYKLEENGLGIIILPDGEIFDGNSQWSKTFRKWLLNNVNLKMIIKMPQGTFDHAGVKTNVLVFTKNGKTENIQYFDTTKECNVVKELFTITEEDFKSTNYSLDMSAYLVEEETNFDVPMVKLEEILEDVNIKSNIPKEIIPGPYMFYTSSRDNKTCNQIDTNYNYEGEHIIHGTRGSTIKESIFYTKEKFSVSGNVIISKSKENVCGMYVYLYLKYNPNILNITGTAIPMITKTYYYNIKIPLPSLEIQEKIVEELSMIETNIKSIKTRIEQLKKEKERFKKYSRKSEIKELLKDTEIKTLGEVCDFNGYKNLKRSEFIDGEYPVIGGGQKPAGFHNKYNKKENTILCSGTGSYAGFISKYKTKVWASEAFSIEPKNEYINNNYIYYCLVNEQQKIYSMRPANAGQPHMYSRIITELKLKVPTPEIQEQCIQIYKEKESFIQSIDDKIELEKNYIDELKNLTKDIISSYC